MTDPYALLDTYAARRTMQVSFQRWDVQFPQAFAALRGALDEHPEFPPDSVASGLCAGCRRGWPCPTVQAITRALEGA